MPSAMIRRCAVLLIEARETSEFDFESLVSGGDAIKYRRELVALAPHLVEPTPVEPSDVDVLHALSAHRWTATADAIDRFGAARIESLLARGLLVDDSDSEAGERDAALRATHWWGPAAAMHFASRWRGVVAPEGAREHGPRRFTELLASLGDPPPHVVEHAAPGDRLALPRAPRDAFDDLLDRRATCRNFDTARALPAAAFAQLLERVFAARDIASVPPGVDVLKRTSPSGGGLHPTEAYVLVQRVDGVAPGLYHYHPVDHALEPLAIRTGVTPAEFALAAVAGQEYFADAHVLVILATRFERSFWKYRNHSKAFRAAILDVGHLSQTLYLAATNEGLAAFVTAAINEVDIEQAIGLDPTRHGPLAICGAGLRSPHRRSAEFDPSFRVWPESVS